MIICDDKRFVFIHIPKCAGTSLRRQLEPYDSRGGRFEYRQPHPILGETDYGHIPLRILAEFFPEEYAAVCNYCAWAVMREPRQRFRSALSQHVRRVRRCEIHELTREETVECAMRAIEKLTDGNSRVDPDFIHFEPQSNYIEHDGERRVENIFPLAALGEFCEAFKARYDIELHHEIAFNRTTSYRFAAFRPAVSRIAIALQKALPAHHYKSLQKISRAVLSRPAASPGDDWLESDEITSFVKAYYRRDIELYNALTSQDMAA